MSAPLRPTSAHSCAGRPTLSRSASNAEVAQFAHGVGLQVDADAERPHLAHGFKDDARHADLLERQRGDEPADAAAGNDDWF